MIETYNLSKQFDQFLAVDQVNLAVAAGQVLALLGPNGAGKTTTVRMLTSILRPSHGTARVAGFDVVKDAPQVRAHVGVLTENHGLYDRMPAGEYLDFFGELYHLDTVTRRARIQDLLERFGIYGEINRRTGEFSKGMRQKLALARALLHQPPVLLLDEPTSAMDPESARLVRDAILDLRTADRALIICTHNLAEAEELADQIAIIRHGRIIAQGTPESLKLAMLGPAEYEVRLASNRNGHLSELIQGVELTASGEDWIRYQTSHPEEDNPRVLRQLLALDLPITGLYEVPRSLEKVYLQVVASEEGETPGKAGDIARDG
jgi:ABC-2 type transport system ATP-binding protein